MNGKLKRAVTVALITIAATVAYGLADTYFTVKQIEKNTPSGVSIQELYDLIEDIKNETNSYTKGWETVEYVDNKIRYHESLSDNSVTDIQRQYYLDIIVEYMNKWRPKRGGIK